MLIRCFEPSGGEEGTGLIAPLNVGIREDQLLANAVLFLFWWLVHLEVLYIIILNKHQRHAYGCGCSWVLFAMLRIGVVRQLQILVILLFPKQNQEMQAGRTNSELNLFSPFLLKFEGRMTQVSKKGTLTAPPAFTASFQRHANKLTEKRAYNILLDLQQIRNKNAKTTEHMAHFSQRIDDSPTSPIITRQNSFATVVQQKQPPSGLCPSIMAEGGFSQDFRRMLRELDNISVGRKNK